MDSLVHKMGTADTAFEPRNIWVFLLFFGFILNIFMVSSTWLFFFFFWLCWVFVSVRGLSLVAVRGPVTVAASLVEEHKLQTCRLSSCGSRA